MSDTPEIRGLEQVMAGFWKVKGSTAATAEVALREGAAFLLAESQKRVPVEYGDLKASGFIKKDGSGFRTKYTVGYTAPYALWVHELVEMKLRDQPRPSGIGVYWDPRPMGQAKYLEEPARTLRPQILKAIYGGFMK